jgi:uncharacterized membrane protein YkvA (DUF1232 family)
MADRNKRTIISNQGSFFSGVSDHLKLILRLMGDRRVSPFLKMIPIGTLAYLFIPDLVIGPLDDAAIIGLGMYVFVELCPPEIVEEHRAALSRTIPGQWHDPQQTGEDEVVDAQFRDED